MMTGSAWNNLTFLPKQCYNLHHLPTQRKSLKNLNKQMYMERAFKYLCFEQRYHIPINHLIKVACIGKAFISIMMKIFVLRESGIITVTYQ